MKDTRTVNIIIPTMTNVSQIWTRNEVQDPSSRDPRCASDVNIMDGKSKGDLVYLVRMKD